MLLENLVIDAVDPQRLGRFWEAVLGGERLTDGPDGFETRLSIEGGPVLDLCFQCVPDPPSEPPRLHLDLSGGTAQNQEVERLLGLGGRHLDIGQRDVPWVVLADPEGNPCCVMEDRAVYADTGPIAALPLDSAEPDRDAAFWSWLTGWTDVAGVAPRSLRHPSLLGPLLELCPERARKGTTKNRLHFDIRLEPGDEPDGAAASIAERGGRELHPEWASCRGGSTQTRPATSSTCFQRGREEQSQRSERQADGTTEPQPARTCRVSSLHCRDGGPGRCGALWRRLSTPSSQSRVSSASRQADTTKAGPGLSDGCRRPILPVPEMPRTPGRGSGDAPVDGASSPPATEHRTNRSHYQGEVHA